MDAQHLTNIVFQNLSLTYAFQSLGYRSRNRLKRNRAMATRTRIRQVVANVLATCKINTLRVTQYVYK